MGAVLAATPAWPDSDPQPAPTQAADSAGEASESAAPAEAQRQIDSLRQEIAILQAEKAELQKLAHPAEPKVTERSAAARAAADRQADLLAQLGQVQILLREKEADLLGLKETNAQLAATNRELDLRVTQAQRDLKTVNERKASASEAEGLRRQLNEANAQLAALTLQEKAAAEELAIAVQDGKTARARVMELEKDLAANAGGASDAASFAALKQQLEEAKAALDKSNASVKDLVEAKARLAEALAAAQSSGSETASAQEALTQARRELADLAGLRDENVRLRQTAASVDDVKSRNAQLTRDNERLTTFMNGNRGELDQAQARVIALEKQLLDATTVRTEGGDAFRKMRAELDDANRTVEKLTTDVAELTGANDKLEMDLANAQKSTAAALAAQSQAVNAASPDSYRMELGTLNERIKQLEIQMEEERAGAAREVATLANQLQRTRETNRSLTEANRALVAAKDSENSASKDDFNQLQARIKELTATGEELRRQALATAADLRALTAERDDLKSQLVDARKVATVLPGLADEKAALQERLEAVGTELVQSQRDEEALQKANADLTKQLATSEDAAEKAAADLAALRGKVADAEKAADSHNASVADLTAANDRLEKEKVEMTRLVDSYRADIARLTQNVRNSEQQRVDAERGGQQNIDALTAQLTQARRELEAARVTTSRLAEGYAAQERDRNATIAQLRSDNGALTARLTQAQGTLDQIAAAARLGTPASTIAAGGPVPVVRTTAAPPAGAAEMRVHTVAEGDSLSRISMRFYGTPNRWQEVYRANRDILQGSSALRVGQQLRIP